MPLRVTLLLSVTAVLLSIVAHHKDPEIVPTFFSKGLEIFQSVSDTLSIYYKTLTHYLYKNTYLHKVFPDGASEENSNFIKTSENSDKNDNKKKKLVMTKEELSHYTGEYDSKGLYVAIMGSVFDVEKGRQHYGPGGGYHFFAGKDGSRAYVTGDFTPAGLTDNVDPLNSKELKSLYDWYKFYVKDYTLVGRVVGFFYDENGKATSKHHKVLKAIKEAEKAMVEEEKEKIKFPPCNVEWNRELGSRLWCSPKSGGIQRDWAGVPRRMVKAGSKSQCVCVQPELALADPRIGEYEDCPPDETSCWVSSP